VKQQMDFWAVTTMPNRLVWPEVWERVTPEEQAMVIAALARLISKAVLQEHIKEIQEKSHEP
jgi:hypothetical protein